MVPGYYNFKKYDTCYDMDIQCINTLAAMYTCMYNSKITVHNSHVLGKTDEKKTYKIFKISCCLVCSLGSAFLRIVTWFSIFHKFGIWFTVF